MVYIKVVTVTVLHAEPGTRRRGLQQTGVLMDEERRRYCHNEDGRIQLRKESLLQEVIHSEKLNGAFRRAEAELP